MNPGDRSQDSGFAATGDFILRRGLFKQAAQARGQTRQHRHRLTGESQHAAVNERPARCHAAIVNQELGRGIVGAVDYEVVAGDDFGGILRVECADDRMRRQSRETAP